MVKQAAELQRRALWQVVRRTPLQAEHVRRMLELGVSKPVAWLVHSAAASRATLEDAAQDVEAAATWHGLAALAARNAARQHRHATHCAAAVSQLSAPASPQLAAVLHALLQLGACPPAAAAQLARAVLHSPITTAAPCVSALPLISSCLLHGDVAQRGPLVAHTLDMLLWQVVQQCAAQTAPREQGAAGHAMAVAGPHIGNIAAAARARLFPASDSTSQAQVKQLAALLVDPPTNGAVSITWPSFTEPQVDAAPWQHAEAALVALALLCEQPTEARAFIAAGGLQLVANLTQLCMQPGLPLEPHVASRVAGRAMAVAGVVLSHADVAVPSPELMQVIHASRLAVQSPRSKLSATARRAQWNAHAHVQHLPVELGLWGPMLYPLHGSARASDSDVDIVLVHGLRGRAFSTWRCPAVRWHEAATAIAKATHARPHERATSAPRAVPGSLAQLDNWRSKAAWLAEQAVLGRSAAAQHAVLDQAARDDSARDNTKAYVEHRGMRLPLWPAAWLPAALAGSGIRARVITVRWDAELFVADGWRAGQSFQHAAEALRRQLAAAGVGQASPVVWVTHSMGGLLAKTALTQAARSSSGSAPPNSMLRADGMVFFAVPHEGSPIARGVSATAWPGLRELLPISPTVAVLSEGSPVLAALDGEWLQLLHSWIAAGKDMSVVNLCEGRASPITPIASMTVVAEASAAPAAWASALPRSVYQHELVRKADHMTICKPDSPEDLRFRSVLQAAQRAVREACREGHAAEQAAITRAERDNA